MSELVKRIGVAVILIPATVFLTVYENTVPFAAGVYILVLLGNRELVSLFRRAGEPVTPAISWLGAIIIPLSFYFTGARWFHFTFVLAAVVTIVFIAKLFSANPVDDVIRYVSVNIFAALFLPLMASFIWLLRDKPGGAHWLLYLFVAVWASDALAYFFGSKFGRRKIVPKVSPNKSLEGFLAGIIGGVAIAALFYYLFVSRFTDLSALKLIIMSADVVAAGILGDLFESMLKRNANVKNSGDLFPGHGGALDRLDSLLFAAPVLYIYLTIWGVL